MIRFLLLAAFISIGYSGSSQRIPLVNAREVIDQGKLLYDSGNYPAAIKKYLTIPKRDTAYVYMLSELALAYLGNKEYDKAITICKEGLDNPSIYRAHFLRSEAVATDRKGSFNEAVALFEKAISTYPFDYGLIFNLGITYYNHKDYDLARDCFFRVLSIFPFHQGSHLNLAILSAAQGKKTHAMLSFGIYLSINTEDNKRLVLLENVASNQFADEGSIPFHGNNAFEKLDQIIRARIALESSYKSKIDFDAAIVKQFQMFFDQLSSVDTQAADPWSDYYVSIYQGLKENDMIEPFIYHLLKSTNNEKVVKWNKKNEKRVNAFFDLTNASIRKKREKLLAPEAGIKQLTQAWYANDNKLEAVGNKDANGVRQGKWVFYHSNAQKSAEGTYSLTGEKSGTWQFFRNDGSVSSIENYETGEVRVFKDGVLSQFFYLKNDKIHGNVELYNTCGILQEKLSYIDGKRIGNGSVYFSSGKVKQTYHFENDKLEGQLVNYFESGQVLSKMIYKDNLLNGPYTEFYSNGKLEMTGAYVAGELEGNWKYYHGNGRLERTGNFAKGLALGEWIYFDTRGINTEKKFFNNEGNYDGEQTVFYNEKIYYVNTYKNDLLVKTIYYNDGGKEIGSSGNPKALYEARNYYPSGQLAATGAIKNGKFDGRWIYYFPEGSKQSEFIYTDGHAEGAAIEYYKSGSRKIDSYYKEGKLHGYFVEYFPHGQKKQEGWFSDGQRQQQWITFYPDGVIQANYYYLNDELMGGCEDYYPDGKLSMVSDYKSSRLVDLKDYGYVGKVITEKSARGAEVIYQTNYSSGKSQSKFTSVCGQYTDISRWFPNGKLYFSYKLLSGKRYGDYYHHAINGQVVRKGNYINNEEEGIWQTYYETGKPETSGAFLQGTRDSTWLYHYENGKISAITEYSNDERHGISKIFSPDGSLILEKLFFQGHFMAYRKMKSDGTPEPWETFSGNNTIVALDPNGKKSYEENFKNGVVDGVKSIYYKNGNLYSEYRYVLGDYSGDYSVYFENGKLLEKGSYKLDELHGPLERYNEDGTLRIKEHYVMGTRDGKATFFKNGTKAIEFNFYGGMTHD